MAAYQTQQINVGSIAAPDVGSVFANFADRINRQQNNQLDNMRQAAQFDRQQVLNQRADQEWNRQQGIIQAKKDVASDFAKNQYAEMYGGRQENAGLDKQVLDYVDNGGEINDDLAKRIQGLYETHKPFREDATAALTQQLISKGLSAADATAEASGMTMGLPSRVELQTRSDAQRKATQDYYDNLAKAKVEAAKLNVETGKANQGADIQKAELQQKANQLLYGTSGGGTTVKGGIATGGAGGISDILSKVGPFDAKDAQEQIEGYLAKGYTDQQIYNTMKTSIDTDPTALVIHDNKVNFDAMDRALAKQTPGAIPYNVSNIRDISSGVTAADLMPQIAPYNVVDYKPNALLDRARQVAPELFRGDPNKITEETKVSNPTSGSSGTGGNTLADRNNNPGNLRVNPRNEWQGGRDGEKGFVKFDTPELGARALAKTINNNVGMTVAGFINKYAPPSENDTNSYVNQVSKRLGKESTSTISKEDIPELMKVISKREGGSFTNDQLMNGYKLFLNETTKGDTSGLPEVTSVDKSYDRLSNIIEPTLDKNTKIETQEQKQELINKYEPIIQKVEDNFKKNHGGPIDDQVAVSKLMMELKIPKNRAIRMYQEITDPLQQKTQIDNYYNQFGGVGVKTQAQQDEINSKVSNEPPMTIMDIIDGYNKFPGIKSFEDQDSTDRLVQKLRASTLAEKYKNNPASLTANERNWILQSKTTPNGRKQLQELGIE